MEPQPPAQEAAAGFQCPNCDRSFTTKTGLGVHRRRAHPSVTNEEIDTTRVKARWSDEEVMMMAAEEVRLVRAGLTFLNEPLAEFLPGRTIEAVKGKRRTAAYKTMVADLASAPTPPNHQQRSDADDAEDAEEEAENAAEAPPPPPPPPSASIAEHLRACIDGLATPHRGTIAGMVMIAESALAYENVEPKIDQWLANTFPGAKKPRGPALGTAVEYSGSAREKRRARYARVQSAFKKNTRDAARMVLQDTDTTNIILPDKTHMLDYWETTLSRTQEPDDEHTTFPRRSDRLDRMWRPITEDEVRRAKVARNSACGLDGVKATAWSRINPKAKEILFNIFLLTGKITANLRTSRTVFLAKKKGGSTNPSEFRPISISSVVTRHFHKILAKRMTTLYHHDGRQSAYQHIDGVGRSVALMNSILDVSWRDRKELHVACLDAAKAFNSVTFNAIFRTLEAVGCSSGFVAYIKGLYSDVATTMQFEGDERVSSVGRGVLQGDPLSGPIFMAVYECAILHLDKNIGFRREGQVTNALAYADDIVLLASTRHGLQKNLNHFDEGLRPLGLELNASKSMTLSLVPSGRDKKIKVATDRPFRVANNMIKPKGIDEVWTYLGLNFEGKNIEMFDGKLSAGLENITRAPLKPQQRLELLKTYVIPGVLHKLVLGATTSANLRRADITLRAHVRRWLHLAKDVPIAFFHAAERHGGLGLPCLQHVVPLHRYNRYIKIADSIDDQMAAIKTCAHMRSTVYRAKQALRFLGDEPSSTLLRDHWRNQLWGSVDGGELEMVPNHKSSSSWCTTLRHNTSGEDFVHGVAIRINSIPSRDRTTRGRKQNMARVATLCRGGCPVPETTYHCIQTCFRTKAMRISRHNRVVDLLEGELQHRGFAVTKEKRLVAATGEYTRPDLIAVKDRVAYVIDAQVVAGQNVELSHMTKIRKYRDRRGFDEDVQQKHDATRVSHIPCTITYRGLWSANSVNDLVEIGVSGGILHRIVTSVLRGSWYCWKMFNRVGVTRRQTEASRL